MLDDERRPNGANGKGNGANGQASRVSGGAVSPRSIVDAGEDLVAVLDRNGRVQLANRCWAQFARENGGTDASTGVGANVLAVLQRSARVGCADAARVLRSLEAALAGDEDRFSLEHSCDFAAHHRWFELHLRALDDGAGVLLRYSDVSERRRAQEALRSVARFPGENPFPVLRMASRGVLAYANRAAEAQLGAWASEIGCQAPAAWAAWAEEALATRSLREVEVDVGERAYYFYFAPFSDVGYVNIYGHDITKRRRAEQELLQATEVLRLHSAALESAANGVVITETSGRILWVNPAFERLTGYPACELIGSTPRLLRSGEHPPEYFDILWSTILAGDVWRGETVNRRGDGTNYVVEQTITPVRDERGTLTHFVGIQQDVTERKEAQRVLTELATTDALTGLLNRRHFHALAGEELQRFRRFGGQFCVLMVDVDHFKRINDSHGHLFGDRVLREVAQRVLSSLRSMDLAARFGGEEFVALLLETDIDAGRDVAERIRRRVAESPVRADGVDVCMSVSIGATQVDGGDVTVDALLDRADRALYTAKEAGRDRVAVHRAWGTKIAVPGLLDGS